MKEKMMIKQMFKNIILNVMEGLLERPSRWEIFKEVSTLPMISKITISSSKLLVFVNK